VGVNLYTTISGGSLASSTLSVIKERNRTKMLPLPNSGGQKVTITGTTNMWDIFGVSREQYLAEPQAYGSSVSGNPAYQLILGCIVVDPEARTTQTVYVDADLAFHSQMWAYVAPPQS
jgi:hypothetical protein